MSSYSDKLLINCVHADYGGGMCIIYFLDSKCDTLSLLSLRDGGWGGEVGGWGVGGGGWGGGGGRGGGGGGGGVHGDPC